MSWTVLILVGTVTVILGLNKVEDPFCGVLCLQTLLCLAQPNNLPAEASEELMKEEIPTTKLPHLLFITPFLAVLLDPREKQIPLKGKKAFSAAGRSWRAAGRAGRWLLGKARLRNYDASREAWEKAKDAAEMDNFITTSFI